MTDQDKQDQHQEDITEALEQGNQQSADDDFEMQYEDYLKLLQED